MDNRSINKTSKVKKLLEANIIVLNLPWYIPQWASVEWCFTIMKNALRDWKCEGMINLSSKKNYSVIHNCLNWLLKYNKEVLFKSD